MLGKVSWIAASGAGYVLAAGLGYLYVSHRCPGPTAVHHIELVDRIVKVKEAATTTSHTVTTSPDGTVSTSDTTVVSSSDTTDASSSQVVTIAKVSSRSWMLGISYKYQVDERDMQHYRRVGILAGKVFAERIVGSIELFPATKEGSVGVGIFF